MRFGSFITTFDRPQVLRECIEAVLDQTRKPDVFLVVDNGSAPATREVVDAYPTVEYVSPGDNLGSAGGCAYGIEQLYDRGCDWMHSIDDDNAPKTDDTIERMIALIERHPDERLGAVAATGANWDWAVGEVERISDSSLSGDLEIDIIGGSNQLTVSRAVVDAIGTPEKQFFFGFYDPLYSLRIKQAGFTIRVDGDLMRTYREATGRTGVAYGRSIRPRDPQHALWRRYYVSRNYIFRMRTTFRRPDLARREAMKGLARAAMAWTRGPSYGLTYTRLQVRGIADGYRGRLGRRVEPVKKPHFF